MDQIEEEAAGVWTEKYGFLGPGENIWRHSSRDTKN